MHRTLSTMLRASNLHGPGPPLLAAIQWVSQVKTALDEDVNVIFRDIVKRKSLEIDIKRIFEDHVFQKTEDDKLAMKGFSCTAFLFQRCFGLFDFSVGWCRRPIQNYSPPVSPRFGVEGGFL